MATYSEPASSCRFSLFPPAFVGRAARPRRAIQSPHGLSPDLTSWRRDRCEADFLEELNQQSRAEPMRCISTGGIVIVLGGPQQKALSVGAQAMPVIEQAPVMEIESDDEQPVATNARRDQSLYHRDRE